MQQQHKRQCVMCHLWLPYSDFSTDKRNSDRLTHRCRKCDSQYRKQRYTQSDGRRRIFQKYGITSHQYNRMLAEQNGACAICKRPETRIDYTGSVQSLSVDHDHKTGDVRALLCTNCNTALGFMNEDPERIRALLRYAEWCQARDPSNKIIQLPMLDLGTHQKG